MAAPAHALNGQDWRNASAATRDGIIRGFLACQATEQAFHEPVDVAQAVARVSAHYAGTGNAQGALFRVILHAEKPTP